jgi:hypothetical protein
MPYSTNCAGKGDSIGLIGVPGASVNGLSKDLTAPPGEVEAEVVVEVGVGLISEWRFGLLQGSLDRGSLAGRVFLPLLGVLCGGWTDRAIGKVERQPFT